MALNSFKLLSMKYSKVEMSVGQSANLLVLKVCHDFEQFISVKVLVKDKYFL
jgi:hypothetical protein